MLLGTNCGSAVESINLPDPAKALSSEHDFDLQVGLVSFAVLAVYIRDFLRILPGKVLATKITLQKINMTSYTSTLQ